MNNLTTHFLEQPLYAVLLVLCLIIILINIPYFINQYKTYGKVLTYASSIRKNLIITSSVLALGLFIYGLMPYQAPPSKEIVVVIGNTQNTPLPKLTDEVSSAIEKTMLEHKGAGKEELVESIKFISAVKNPQVIDLSSGLDLKDIGKNNSNAKRSASINIKLIQDKIDTTLPTDNGANYFEAILKARDNASEGSRIIVIGSGLSDSGDMNFSKLNLLTNEQSRNKSLNMIVEKFGNNYLESYTVDFYGLGDTVLPQEPLTSKNRAILREIYRSTIKRLGGDVVVHTKTITGASVNTQYIVGTTDTGCGDVGLIFDDESLKFISDQAKFSDELTAKNALMTIKSVWDSNPDLIELIQIDGFIARYPGPDNLSQQRADAVKAALIQLGIPSEKINSTGKGFGPYESDTQNRMVKVNIIRSSENCSN